MKKIKIGGVDYAAKLGLKFLENVTKGENITVAELFPKLESETLLFIPKLLHYSINTGLVAEGKETVKDDLIYNWLDEKGINCPEVQAFIKDLGDSIMVHFPKDEAVGKPKAPKPKN